LGNYRTNSKRKTKHLKNIWKLEKNGLVGSMLNDKRSKRRSRTLQKRIAVEETVGNDN
jgi:hypothetical protein